MPRDAIANSGSSSSYVALRVRERWIGKWGAGDTPQAVVEAALEGLGQPLASDLAEKVPG